MKVLLLVLGLVLINQSFAQNMIEIQGHRGARGILPENSIIGFKKAVDLGVQTLELDIIISGDRQVVVSHEPWLNPDICKDPDGNIVKDKSFNLYEMTYEEISKCDCGGMGNSKYPEQEKISTYKPLLSEMLQVMEAYCSDKGVDIKYNVEIKSNSKEVNKSQPPVDEYIALVFEVVKEIPLSRINIQSFDKEVLIAWKKTYPDYELAYLVGNLKSWNANIEDLGFTPEIYSPNYRLINSSKVKEIQAAGMKVIPWTVNKVDDLEKVMDYNVDGIITDYPGRAIELLKARN